VTAATMIDLPGNGLSRFGARIRDERGVGLVELLIALLVLNIGLFAMLGAFSSGALALQRASHVSTASAIADQEMEKLRDSSYATITALQTPQVTNPWPNAPDGRSYKVEVQATPFTPTGGQQIEQVTVKVTDVTHQLNKLLVTTSSTFSQCAQDMSSTACGGS
jgi:Tfp pilus assembly protein PilV